MASDVTLHLREQFLTTDAIWLEADGYDTTPREDFELMDREQDDSDLMVNVHRDTGEVLLVVVEQFTSETELAIKRLREYPLAWTFSLPELKVKEKPLEDVLAAVYKKHKNVKIIGDK